MEDIYKWFSLLILAGVALKLLVTLLQWLFKRYRLKNEARLYRAARLLTQHETAEFWKIKQVTDQHGLLLFAKVRMIDLAEPIRRDYQIRNKVQAKHLDFVVLNRDGSTLCAIELDDASHSRRDRRASDEFKDMVFANIGVPLIRETSINMRKLESAINGLVAEAGRKREGGL